MAAPASQRITPKKRTAFLEALAACGNVSQAARTVGAARETFHRLRTHDAEFAAAWDDALEEAADRLEQEAWRRAHDGVEEPLTCAKGLILDDMGNPVMVRKYSDTLLIFLLKGARPQKYRDNVTVTAPATLGVSVVLEHMRNDRTIANAANDFLGLIAAASEAR